MESTEKCEAIITHFNGKYIKTPAGVPGEASGNQAERAIGCYFQWRFWKCFAMRVSGVSEVGLSCVFAFFLGSPIWSLALQICWWWSKETTEPREIYAKWTGLAKEWRYGKRTSKETGVLRTLDVEWKLPGPNFCEIKWQGWELQWVTERRLAA